MSYVVPETLETDRLKLRMFKDEDWQDLHILYSDEETTRYTIRRVLDEDDSWRTMAMLIGHWQLRGYGPYAVEEKVSGTVMGYVGLWYPRAWPEPEIAWALARSYWGKGFASEAARCVKAMAHKHLPDIPFISMTDKNNSRSRKLAESLGAKFERELVFKDHLCVIYRHQYT